ncbi:hypothetical protein COB55_05665 [Candidatus Wolfebacteria bacterium]|nr:MAG: hypothetical protein COB55_05665 [Candidatus Wolfebacteria bacterium]
MEKILRAIEKIIPTPIYTFGQPFYHRLLAFFGALFYRFPSHNIKIVAVTGTKGKTSTVEFVNSTLEGAGFKTALASTLHFKVGENDEPNLYKMTTPGRFFLQKFLRRAISAKCDWVVLELTSEAVKQMRHLHISLDALIFTNLAPEHIESHGSFENYRDAKRELGIALSTSSKLRRVMIANSDDPESAYYLSLPHVEPFPFSLETVAPYSTKISGASFTFDGLEIRTAFPGTFTIYNALAASMFARSQNIDTAIIRKSIEHVQSIPGRAEKIDAGQDFSVIVDYAHTPDSLIAIYSAYPDRKKICILGSTGGGRDTWKRPEMGAIAENYCSEVILTNEDPYDEDPQEIVDALARGFKTTHPKIILDRRGAIRTAISHAKTDDVILITGKGTDPYIMGPNGTKQVWSDAKVSKEELSRILEQSQRNNK